MPPLRAFRRRIPFRRRAPFLLVPCALALAAAGGMIGPLRPASAADPGSTNPLQTIRTFAEIFAGQQNTDGSYQLTPNVQAHLKAEIAMALAAEATGRRDFLLSAHRDLDWVIANRLEADGGINWNGPQSDYFFEVHQHWFLIASELIRRQEASPGAESIKDVQRSAWLYLLRNNPALADFYQDNQARHGVFFAYRDIDRRGHFQTQAPFKGSYEIGAALWSMALHRDDAWLMSLPGSPIDSSLAPSRYLARMVPQIVRPLGEHGFFDPEKRTWIRSVLWNGIDWSDYEPPDFKYVPHMEEGALLYTLLTGRSELLLPAQYEIEEFLSRVYPDGSIRGVPDGYGTPAYEYGTILSCLGLSARLFAVTQPDLGRRVQTAAQRVFQYAARTFDAISSEDRAMLLAGFCRLAEAQRAAADLADGRKVTPGAALSIDGPAISLQGEAPALTGPSATLLASPNPMRDRIRFLYSIPPEESGTLRVIDASGRRCYEVRLASGSREGQVSWDGLDDEGRHLPAGSYQAVLEAGSVRRITRFAILR